MRSCIIRKPTKLEEKRNWESKSVEERDKKESNYEEDGEERKVLVKIESSLKWKRKRVERGKKGERNLVVNGKWQIVAGSLNSIWWERAIS